MLYLKMLQRDCQLPVPTYGGITARLVKLCLIEDTPSNRAGQGNRPPESSPPSPVDPEDCPF